MRPIKERDGATIEVIDQTRLPFELVWQTLGTVEAVATAIRTMVVRGAPLIGVTAAYGLAFALRTAASDATLATAIEMLRATRPTAVNLPWALEQLRVRLAPLAPHLRAEAAWLEAGRLAEAEALACRRIGEAGAAILRQTWESGGKKSQFNVLTHCNAGMLATVEWGTALAPVYLAHQLGVPVHVWVDETRPRNQGGLTVWELGQHQVPHTLIVDNAGGLLMQRGEVDLCIVGADRIARNGDVCNKVGTYLKALAARAHDVPFYVAAPVSTIDLSLDSGAGVIIEERDGDEIREWKKQLLFPPGTPVRNPAFDITPGALVKALITERGVCAPSMAGALFT